jgi:hypothetical protein
MVDTLKFLDDSAARRRSGTMRLARLCADGTVAESRVL